MNQTMERIMAAMMIEMVVARLTVSNMAIMMLESSAVEVWTRITVRVWFLNSQTGVRNKELFMLLTRMEIDGIKM